MRLRDFIREHRTALDEAILLRCPNVGRLNDGDRREWVLNDEGLYTWARTAGVRV